MTNQIIDSSYLLSCITQDHVLNIPKGITGIRGTALRNSSIASINFPSGFKAIEDDVFNYCERLTLLVLPETLEIIGSHAFASCSSLTDLIIPGGVKNISDCAFAHCISLKTVQIKQGVEQIGENAFTSCLSLTNITLPSTILEIADNAFDNTDSIKGKMEFTIRAPANSYAEQYAKRNKIGFTPTL